MSSGSYGELTPRDYMVTTQTFLRKGSSLLNI